MACTLVTLVALSMKLAARETSGGASPGLGYLCMVVAMIFLPGIDALAKLLSATVPVGQIAAARFGFQVLFLLPVMLVLSGWGSLRSRRSRVHALRGMLLAMVSLLIFGALKVMPIADAIAIFFIEPLLLTLLCGLLLGEPVGWRRLLAVVVGFGGALLIIQPGFQEIGWYVLLPVGSALCFAFYLVVTRLVAADEDPVVMQCHSGFYGAVFLLLALVAGSWAGVDFLTPVVPSPREWVLLAALGLIATVGHVLVVYAFRHAQAVVLAPFQYLEIIGATLLGWLLFGDLPGPLTWLGIVIIVGSGLFVYHRERYVAKRSPGLPLPKA